MSAFALDPEVPALAIVPFECCMITRENRLWSVHSLGLLSARRRSRGLAGERLRTPSWRCSYDEGQKDRLIGETAQRLNAHRSRTDAGELPTENPPAPCALVLDKCQQFPVDPVGHHRAHPVRAARNDFQCPLLQQLH